MNNLFGIGIYSKRGNRAGLVFRKNNNKVLYRVSTIERADVFCGTMYDYTIELGKERAEPEFLIEIHSSRNKMHVLEIALSGNEAEVRIYEMIDGCSLLRFKWNGDREGLMDGLDVFSILRLLHNFKNGAY